MKVVKFSLDVKIGASYVCVSTTDQENYPPDSQLKLIRIC